MVFIIARFSTAGILNKTVAWQSD